jgi:hypothetical protein
MLARLVWTVTMKSCEACRLTESQALADAKTLGLLEEFRCGVYTCCQINAWAQEQWLAWFEAVEADAFRTQDGLGPVEESEAEAMLVPVRLRRPVPWYRRA